MKYIKKIMYKIVLNIKFYEQYDIKKTLYKIYQIIDYIKLKDISVVNLPAKKKQYTVLRSPHIDKKSREQFILKKQKKKIILHFDKNSIYSIFLFFLKNSQFSGVEIEIIAQNLTFFIPSEKGPKGVSPKEAPSVLRTEGALKP